MEVRRGGVVVVRAHEYPSDSVIGLFRASFRRHPISGLDPETAGAFLQAFAQHAILLVARDRTTSQDLGFAIGGETAVLNRLRGRFIRSHAWRIAASSARNASLRRMLFARMQFARKIARPYSRYQLRFIAVAGQARGLGIGTLLLEAFEKILPAGYGYHAWMLAADHDSEQFYLARGFHKDVAVDGHLRMVRVPDPIISP